MATPYVQLDKPSGLYTTPQRMNWILSDEVSRFAFTVNGNQPTLSQYIAYDRLNPPKPFLATTQDGRGNVVYDGGFPKFYNARTPAAGAGFSQMSAAFKYLWNAVNFCANPLKVAQGNKKVLILGDAITTQYKIDSTGTNGFSTSFRRLFASMGFSPTFKTVFAFPGRKLDVRYEELDQYALVLLMSSEFYKPEPLITTQCIQDMVAYREAGNGLIIITDHGIGAGGFYRTANALIANFGAYFTGDYDRSPVNVGFLRNTYGDHALYNGMSDSESIYMGKSESQIVVTQYPYYTADDAPEVPMLQDGRYVVSILAQLHDGTVTTYRYIYNIVLGEFVWWVDDDGNKLGPTHETRQATNDFVPLIENPDLGTLMGYITRNGKRLGRFSYGQSEQIVYKWLSGDAVFPVSDGDVFNIEFFQPFNYNKRITIKRFMPPIQSVIDHAHSVKLLRVDEYANVKPRDLVRTIINDIKDLFPDQNLAGIGNTARDMAVIRKFTGEHVGPETTAYIYATTSDALLAMQNMTTQPACIIDVEKMEVWEFWNNEWVIIPDLKPIDFLGAPRKIRSIDTGTMFMIRVDGSIRIV